MSRPQEETPLFSKTYDLLAWLGPMTNHFPKSHRHSTTQRLLHAAYDFMEQIAQANNCRGRARMERLDAASASLDTVRLYLRLAHRWHWLNHGQYHHVSRMVAEVGRLLGGWQKVTRQQSAVRRNAGDGRTL